VSSPSLPQRFNLGAYLLDRHLDEGHGERLAVICGDRRLCYAELSDLAARYGGLFRAAGLDAGDRVLLVAPDTPDLMAAFLGAIRAGIIPIPVNTMLGGEEYLHLLADSGAKALLVDGALWPRLEPVAARAKGLREVIACGSEVAGLPSAAALLDRAERLSTPANTTADDVAFWLYSSGTTGAPKGVPHRHADMLAELHGYAEGVLGLTAADRTLSAAKLFFAYGLGNGLGFPLGVGATTILHSGKPTPEALVALLIEHRPTVFFGVPSLYAALLQWSAQLQHEAAAREAFCIPRQAVSAGESLPAPLIEAFRERFGLEILDGIGSTEMLHIFISNFPGRVRPGSSGQLVPGYDARIVDEQGGDLPAGGTGHLLVRGGSMAGCYWRQPEHSERIFGDGWCRTGDKYTRDEDGYFWHAGRSDDMLKVKGQWVSPVEVESALLEHPAVRECAVVGREDEHGLVRPHAFVVASVEDRDKAGLERSIRAHVERALPDFKRPHWIEFRPSLPRTATGKLQRFKLRQ